MTPKSESETSSAIASGPLLALSAEVCWRVSSHQEFPPCVELWYSVSILLPPRPFFLASKPHLMRLNFCRNPLSPQLIARPHSCRSQLSGPRATRVVACVQCLLALPRTTITVSFFFPGGSGGSGGPRWRVMVIPSESPSLSLSPSAVTLL